MIPYFIWNNISSIDKNIIVNELPPITIPKKRIEEKQIPGRNGKLYIDEGVYDTFVYQIKCMQEAHKYLNKIQEVNLSSSPQICRSLRKIRQVSTPRKPRTRKSPAAPEPFPVPNRRAQRDSGPSRAARGSKTWSTRSPPSR